MAGSIPGSSPGSSPGTSERMTLRVEQGDIERARQWLAPSKVSPESAPADADSETKTPARHCPCCGGRMIIVETFEGASPARSQSPSRIRIDSS
jgi:hypothetical protein